MMEEEWWNICAPGMARPDKNCTTTPAARRYAALTILATASIFRRKPPDTPATGPAPLTPAARAAPPEPRLRFPRAAQQCGDGHYMATTPTPTLAQSPAKAADRRR